MQSHHRVSDISTDADHFNKASPRRWLSGILGALLLSTAATAQAHKLNLFSYVEGDQVFVEGYFADGKKAKESKVTVHGPDQKVLLEGVTNVEGAFSFKAPQQTNLLITLNAGLGHQTEYLLTQAELTGVESAESATSGETPSSSAGTGVPLDDAHLRRIVRHAVAEGIKPLARELAEYKNKASLSSIIGGIGYIFGILGIVAYMKARKG